MHTDTECHFVWAFLRPRPSDRLFNRWQMIVLSAAVFGMSLAVADAETKKKLFSIEAQPARHSLTLYARQAQVQLGFAADVNDIVTNAVIGEYDVSRALELLLEGTGLQAEHGERGIIIRPVPREEGAGSVNEPATAVAETTSLQLVQTLTLPSAQASTTSSGSHSDREDKGDAKEADELPEIIVTGTNLRGVTNPASPVLVFDREDIERAGQTRLAEFIQTIPQNFQGGLSDTASSVPGSSERGNFGSGTGANLRGLGADSTLVLVNGRRLAPAGVASFTDISTIPLSAVQRIEIITDGSSAIYGSDAIGGVINIILRDELEGAETTIRYGGVTEGDRYEVRASQALGTSWKSGGLFTNYEYFKETPLRSSDRSFTALSPAPYDLTSDTESHSFLVSSSHDFTENLTLFGSGTYSSRDTFTSTTTAGGFPSTFDIAAKQYGTSIGLTLQLPGSWQAEISSLYNKYENDNTTEIPAFPLVDIVNIESEVLSWDAKVDGDIFSVTAGDVKLGLGGGVREEMYQRSVTRTSERDVKYVFGETLVPIVGSDNAAPGVQTLEFSAALRYEDYSDAGSSTDGKIGIVWSPIEQLQFRGTFGTSFRAPLLSESAPGLNVNLVLPAIDPQSAAGVSIGMFLSGSALSDAAPELGTPLRPEEAEVYTIGFDFESSSLAGLYASITYFNIDFTDRISAPPLNPAEVLVDPAFASLVTRSPTPDQLAGILMVTTDLFNFSGIPDDELTSEGVGFIFDGRNANLARTKSTGIDFDIGYSQDTRWGVIGLNIAGTYLIDLEDQLTNEAPFLESLNTFRNPIDLRLRGALSWSRDGWSTGFYVNYSGEYRDNTRDPENQIDSFTTYDLTILYDFEDTGPSRLLRNVKLSFGALNLFDEDPPFVDDSDGFNINYDVRNVSTMGRLLTLQLAKSW